MVTNQSSWVEISQSAFDHNIRTYRSIIGRDTKLSLVIKSNAYGHDTETAARLGQQHPEIDWLCINSLSEALVARQIGVTKPILVINNIDDDIEMAINQNIALIGYSIEQLKILNNIATQCKKPINVHLKVDTGMSRLGFFPDQLLSCISQILQLPLVKMQGIFTHFAESSKADFQYTALQANRFKQLLEALQKRNINIPLRHIANSAAIPTVSFNQANMVRLGAGAYGLYSSAANLEIIKKQHHDFTLKPILRWKTRILAIKDVPSESFVGYSRTFKTNRDTTIGFLPVGHHEGMDKKLSNVGLVYLENKQTYAPIIGMICLNLTMVDLTGTSAQEGDEVILIGSQEEVSPGKIAHQLAEENLRTITGRITPTIKRIIVP